MYMLAVAYASNIGLINLNRSAHPRNQMKLYAVYCNDWTMQTVHISQNVFRQRSAYFTKYILLDTWTDKQRSYR